MNVKIYIAAHKKFSPPKDDIYIPLYVGAAGKKNIGFQRDDIGENISLKNENYCELTGLYWIWKNCAADIVGLVHYRRYFFKNSLTNNIKYILNKKKIKTILSKYDVIVPFYHYYFHNNVRNTYGNLHYLEDYDTCREIIKEKFPEYLVSFDKVSEDYKLYPYNMFITKKEIFDSYCEWLFEIFRVLENKIDISKYDDYNKRIYGFLAERLFNVWLQKNRYKEKRIPVYNIEGSVLKQSVGNNIKKILVKIKRKK